MLSDNVTHYVGAARKVKELVSTSKTESNQGINWQFNPPGAPHFGGVFESMIKSSKRAIYAVLSEADVNTRSYKQCLQEWRVCWIPDPYLRGSAGMSVMNLY